ncbi:hypothetical protein [Aquimarina sp. MMG016]|uniref:hypothetical protein n=1 Tax=Aquimarina sp. MMG016 TaxID=2822690 RepID=UPI001B3A0773|nr:hypothetical protein [Aquimarina sp. MMG016]MBQ4820503.1 hypothetical protein [Aquimarina sp. MMG016]
MKINTVTYRDLPFIKWFFVFTVLFSFGGYSNYTKPQTKPITTELVVSAEEVTRKTVSLQKVLQKYTRQDFYYKDNSDLLSLSSLHNDLTTNRLKIYTSFISLAQKLQQLATLQTSLSSEEDFFHFNLG